MRCAHCDELEVENRELRRDLGYELDQRLINHLIVSLPISRMMAIVLSTLYRAKGGVVSKTVLAMALETESKGERIDALLKTYISTMRVRVGRDVFVTVAKRGYGLSPAGVATITAALARSSNVNAEGARLSA